MKGGVTEFRPVGCRQTSYDLMGSLEFRLHTPLIISGLHHLGRSKGDIKNITGASTVDKFVQAYEGKKIN